MSLLTEAAIAYTASVTPVKDHPSGYPEDIGSKSHHLKNEGGFTNPWPSWKKQGFLTIGAGVARYRMTMKTTEADQKADIPVISPQFPAERSTSSTSFRATWLGHACYYVEFPGGFRALFDPVFSHRCSPVQFMGPARYTKMPCDIKDIPIVDAVIISHNHYDHMDYNTIMKLVKYHPNVWFFVPLGNKKWFTSQGLHNVTELDWWEEIEIELSPDASPSVNGPKRVHKGEEALGSEPDAASRDGIIVARIGCLPCQHASNRGLFDIAATLWASWSVVSGEKKVWFGGDTGYRSVPELPEDVDDYGEEFKDLPVCPVFKQIGELRGPFDLGLIPIGAYKPRWVMSPMHANPFDSVNIFKDTRCERALGMHWGTWQLTFEPYMEPPKLLKQALQRHGLEPQGVFDVLDIGESREFSK